MMTNTHRASIIDDAFALIDANAAFDADDLIADLFELQIECDDERIDDLLAILL